MFHRFGPWGIVILAGVCLLFVGYRLPGAMESLSRNIRGGGPWAGA